MQRGLGRTLGVKGLNALLLLQHGAGVIEKFLALLCQRDAPPLPVKDHDAQLIFQILEDAAQVRLGQQQLPC